MRYIDIIRRAGRSLRNAKGRTILTALAIAVGGFTLTLSLAAGAGAREYASRLIESNVDPQSVFIAKDPSLFGEGGPPGAGGIKQYSDNQTQFGGATFKALNAKDIEKVKNTPNVDSVAVTYVVNAEYFTVEGVDGKYTSDVIAYDSSVRSDVAAGKLPPIGTQLTDDSVVLPEAYLKTLGGLKPSDMIGKTITLKIAGPVKQLSKGEVDSILRSQGPEALQRQLAPSSRDVKLRIAAVSADSTTSFSAAQGLFISDSKARELSEYTTRGTDQYQKYITATAKVEEGVDPETVQAALKDKGLVAQTAKDLQALLFTIVNILQGIVIGFAVIALIASVFGIINTQYISVLERTREIGLMKSLGMRGWSVSKLFMFEAAWIGLLGGILGAGFGWILGSALNPWITERLSLGEGNYILLFQFVPIALMIIGLILVAVLAGLFPAIKAAKLDPIEALRTE